jgi:SAM-dependent methyltransferase
MFDTVLRWVRFNLWYFQNPPWDTGISPPELLTFVREHKPGRALDLGCGSGTNLLFLAKAGWQVTGVDFALRAVERAKQKLARAGLAGSVRVGDVAHLEAVAGPFDLVLDIGCYHSLSAPSREGYRADLGRLLAPGGSFLLYAHLRQGVEQAVGIDENEIRLLGQDLGLAWREDSLDSRARKATWLRFER